MSDWLVSPVLFPLFLFLLIVGYVIVRTPIYGRIAAVKGFAMQLPMNQTTDSDVARACAEMLATSPTPKT